MRILYLLEYYPPHIGGVEILFQKIAEGMAARGHDVRIITMQLKPTHAYQTPARREKKGNLEIIRIRTGERRSLFTLAALPAAIQNARWADVIHTTTYNAAYPAALASMLTRTPALITVHELMMHVWKHLGFSWPIAEGLMLMEHAITRLPFKAFAAVSRYTRNALRFAGVPDSKLHVVYNFTDTTFFKPERWQYAREKIRNQYGIGKNDILLFSSGRPGIEKGHEYLIRAMKDVEDLRQVKLLLALSPRPAGKREKLVRLIKQLGLENIILLGGMSREALAEHMSAADVYIVPSLTEGFGFVGVESCLMAWPDKIVITTDAGALPEVVFGRVIMVRPRSSSAIADAIRQAVLQPEGVKRIPRKDFSAERMIKEYEALYEQLVKKK